MGPHSQKIGMAMFTALPAVMQNALNA
jgi:hypothetical protein